MKRALSAFMLVLLLVSMLTLAFEIQPVRAEPRTWTVDDDGPADFHTIQEAINAANSGDTIFVKAGTYFENVAVDKTVTVTGEDSSNTIIDGNETGNVVHIIAGNVTITGFTIRRSGNGYKNCCGIFVEGVLREPENVIIRKNFLSGNYIGIEFEYAANNTVQENVFSNNIEAIALSYSDRNLIIHNIVSNNSYGLDIRGHYNYVYNNTFANDTDYGIGIALSEGSSNIVRNNLITSNEMYGILLAGDGRNTITGNTISWNTYGIVCPDFFGMGVQNLIYHNNFLSNTIQAYEKRARGNHWDNGYPTGGNYWSDYDETDFSFGPNQDEMGSDGIGDKPFNITEENSQDRYPLMHPWSSLPVHNINTGLGYGTIQEAINADETLNGHTIFVETGTYYENVIVNKTLSFIGESRDATVIDGNGMGFVVQVISNNVTISNFTIMNAFTGISADESAYTRIENNWVRSCYQGIRFWSSFGNVIKGNIITSIMLFSDSGAGILLYGSSNNIITENTITLNEWTGIGFDSSSNNSVSGNNIANNGYGIWLQYTSNNTISGNSIINNDYGIRLYKSSLNNISRNNITANNVDGIWLSDSSNYNSIAENSVANNGQGISLSYSSNNSVAENNITNNNYGIHLVSGASNNSIFGNTITENLNDGIKIEDSYNNTISENTIKNNFCGIWLYESSNNSIYHNNFVITAYTDPWGRKYQHVYTHSAYPNFWDDGYPSGGNYWSNYTGIDEKSGPNQDLPGSDGIGDTPYIIDANNTDRYPLMNPYGSARVIAATVDIDPDVLNLKGKLKWVNAYIELPEGYNISDVDVSTLRLNMTIPSELEPTAIGDYDNDTIPDLMVEFNRTAVSNLILSQGIMTGNVTLTVTGKLNDGTLFKGFCIIKVRLPGDINSDGKVDVKDVALVSFAFGSYPGHPRWKSIADENEDGRIDVRDVSLIARNFGKTYT